MGAAYTDLYIRFPPVNWAGIWGEFQISDTHVFGGCFQFYISFQGANELLGGRGFIHIYRSYWFIAVLLPLLLGELAQWLHNVDWLSWPELHAEFPPAFKSLWRLKRWKNVFAACKWSIDSKFWGEGRSLAASEQKEQPTKIKNEKQPCPFS